MRIAVTGAAGQLGRLTIEALQERGIAANDIVAIVRDDKKASDLAERGIQVIRAPYEDEDALTQALTDVDRLVLISGSEVGQRLSQHTNIINAAKKADVKFIAYTSLLGAPTSTLSLAPEHVGTEELLKESGIDHAILRNGWYWENFASAVDTAKATGHTFGAAGAGKVSGAARKDYAQAAAIVITSDDQAGKIYELAGIPALDYSQIASTIGELLGTTVTYVDQTEADFTASLQQNGLPAEVAQMLAGWDVATARGDLYSESTDLPGLLGRPTTPLIEALRN